MLGVVQLAPLPASRIRWACLADPAQQRHGGRVWMLHEALDSQQLNSRADYRLAQYGVGEAGATVGLYALCCMLRPCLLWKACCMHRTHPGRLQR